MENVSKFALAVLATAFAVTANADPIEIVALNGGAHPATLGENNEYVMTPFIAPTDGPHSCTASPSGGQVCFVDGDTDNSNGLPGDSISLDCRQPRLVAIRRNTATRPWQHLCRRYRPSSRGSHPAGKYPGIFAVRGLQRMAAARGFRRSTIRATRPRRNSSAWATTTREAMVSIPQAAHRSRASRSSLFNGDSVTFHQTRVNASRCLSLARLPCSASAYWDSRCPDVCS